MGASSLRTCRALTSTCGGGRPPAAHDGRRGAGLIEEFVTGERPDDINIDRTLASVLMTDIVGSTSLAERLGDKDGRLLDRHDEVTEREIGRFKGRVVDRAGDGMLATSTGRPGHRLRPRAPHGCRGWTSRSALGYIWVRSRSWRTHWRHRRTCGGAYHGRGWGRRGPGIPNDQGRGRRGWVNFTPRGMHALKGIDGHWRRFCAGLKVESMLQHGSSPRRCCQGINVW